MTALSILVPALKRELAVPGTFDDIFPDTGTNDLIGSLADAFAQARLDGWFGDVVLDQETYEATPDLSDAGGALIVIYSSMRIIRAQLRVITSSETYKAGSVEASTSRPALLLRDELNYLQTRMADLITLSQRNARTCTAAVFDGYLARTTEVIYPGAWGGFFPYEYRG